MFFQTFYDCIKIQYKQKEGWRMIKRFFAATVEFLKEVKVELKKISYPSQSETMGSTTVVLIFVVIISIFLAFVDAVLARMIRIIIGVTVL